MKIPAILSLVVLSLEVFDHAAQAKNLRVHRNPQQNEEQPNPKGTRKLDEEEPTFPYPTEEESLDNQYIVEFERNKAGNKMKKVIMVKRNNEEKPTLIRKIMSRNIKVIKFPSKRAAERWSDRTKGIKYFEKGKRHQ